MAIKRRAIGIVVTLYDDYHYLGECIAHLVRGSREHDLVICLCIDQSRYDSAASETVSDLLNHYGLTPEIVFNYRGGPAVARNQGIRRLLEKVPAIDYFFFMDADNFVSDGDFDTLVACLDGLPDDVVYTYQNIYKFGEIRQFARLDVPFDRWRLLNLFYGETGNLVRARVFREGQFFHEGELLARNTGEDVEFFRRLGALYKGVHCPGTGFHYRTKLVHRDSVYWPKHDILSAWMEQANEGLYERARQEFFQSRFFDIAGIANGAIADLVEMHHEDAARTQRSLLELGRGLLLCFAERSGFDELVASPLKGVLLTELVRDHGKLARLYRFHRTNDEDSFRYQRKLARLRELGAQDSCGLMVLPATACPPFPECRQWNYHDLMIELVDVWGTRVPELPELVTGELVAFFDNWRCYELGREPIPSPSDNIEIYKLPNHGEWLAEQSLKDWRYISSQRDVLEIPPARKAPRICVVAAMVMVGGSDVATLELVKSLRTSFPDACIDVVFAHFVWSESGSNQGDNFKRLDWISSCVDAIIFTDLVQPHLRPAFLRRLLSSYDLIHIETSAPAYWLLKEIKEEGRRPKIVCHLYCWDYYMALRVGFPIFAPKYADVIDVFSCQTQLVADYLSTRNVPRRKIFWIPYTSRFARAPAHKPAADRLRILWIGRWVEQKSPGLLVNAMELLLKLRIEVHFQVLVIDNFDNARHFDESRLRTLQKLAKQFPDKVTITPGPVAESELEKLYLNADVLLSTSAWEGVPFIFYEAMAFGCIPVATDVSANRELIANGTNGILVPAADAHAIAEAVARLCSDAELREILRQGVADSRRENDTGDFVQRHIDLFKALLADELPGDYYRGYTLDRGHALVDAELKELEMLAKRLGVNDATMRPANYSTEPDPLLSLLSKLDEIGKRTALLLDQVGLYPSTIDPTVQIRREGPGITDKAAAFIVQVMERTGLFAPYWMPMLEDAYRTLRHSRNMRELAHGSARFAVTAGRRWAMRRLALRRLRRG